MNSLKKIILLSYICTASISAAIITPALPAIEQGYGLTHGALEWVVSIFLIGYVFGQLIYGPLANRFGRLNALRWGMIVNLIGIGICLLAAYLQIYSLLLLGRLVTAIGASSGLACTLMLIHELLPQNEAKKALAYSVVSFTAGIGIAVLIGGLVTQYWHWQDCFWILFFHGLIMLLLTWLFPETLKEPKALHPKIILTNYIRALKNSQLIIAALIVGFVSAFAYGYSAAAPVFAQTQLQLTASQYGYWNILNMVGMLASGLLGAYWMQKMGAGKLLKLAFGFILPALVSLILIAFLDHKSSIWFFATTTWLYLFTGLLFPVGTHFASHAITDKASAASMLSFINMGSATLSVIIMGYLPFAIIIAFAIILSLFFMMILGLKRFILQTS